MAPVSQGLAPYEAPGCHPLLETIAFLPGFNLLLLEKPSGTASVRLCHFPMIAGCGLNWDTPVVFCTLRHILLGRADLDRIDLRLLALLQEDCTLSIAAMAERVGLSQTPCWKRIQKLEAEGVIVRRVALLSPEALGLGLTVFVSIEAGDHSPEWLERFAAAVTDLPEVVEVHRMAGDVDYMLRVVTRDIAAYDGFYKRLIAAVPIKNISSRFSMERVKSTTALPLPGEQG